MPATLGLTEIQQDNNNAAGCWQISPSQSKSSASSIFANPDEDWRTSTDFEERRRIQSRIAQRQYRRRQKQRKAQQCPEGDKETIHQDPGATEMIEEDFAALEVPSSTVQQQMPFPLSDKFTPEAPHQQFLLSGNEYLMSQHQNFVPQLPSPQASPVTTWLMDTDGQSKPMENFNNLSFPETPQSEQPQLPSSYAMASQQPTLHVSYSSSSCTWNRRATPDHQLTCSFHSSHPRPFRPQSNHFQQHNHDYVTYSQRNNHHDSTSPFPCGCSSSTSYFPSHSCHSHYNTPQPFIRDYHEFDKAWADRKNHIQNPCAYFGCYHHHKGPMDDSHPSYWSRPYAHAPSLNRQTCCCSQDHMHSPPPDIRHIL